MRQRSASRTEYPLQLVVRSGLPTGTLSATCSNMNQSKQLPIVQGACSKPLEMGRLCKRCRLSEEMEGVRRCSRFVAESSSMRALFARVSAIAETSSSVVVQGETGTGKEVVARLIHANSPRQSRPFVALNVAALPPDLLESELFGHVKGAFTGAVNSTHGVFGEADQGTLFLDEIGEMPLPLQAKLLRVVQEGEVRRVGDARASHVDVRILCATHRDLREEVRAGRFREDLYYRLKVFGVHVPALRERREDIVPLARMFATRLGASRFELGTQAKSILLKHDWPGNVRELGNVVEHAVALSRGNEILLDHLPEDLTEPRVQASKRVALRTVYEAERQHILDVLEACGNNQVDAARVLGLGRSTLWRKLREYANAENAPRNPKRV
jgi:DNA-binding NtrC family response regulator